MIAVLFSHVAPGATVASWPLDEGGGTTVVDVAGGHNGTLQGGGAWVTGRFGGALLLDGVDGAVVIPDHPGLDYSSYAGLTLAAWVRPDRVGHKRDQTVFGHWNENHESRTFQLMLRRDDRWQCVTNKKDGTAVSTSAASVGVWAHVACVWTPAGLEVYVDGVLEGSDLAVQGVLDGNSGPHVLGASDVGGVLKRYFQGALDEVALFDQGLSAAEIQALMDGPGDPGPDTTPPVLSNVQASAVSDTTVTITWGTDEAADSVVGYGPDTGYGSSAGAAVLVTSHSVTLTGLTAGTLYHYQVSSTDGSGNTANSLDLTFTTTGGGGGGSPSGLVSDQFDGALNTAVWTFVDPVGDSTVSTTGSQAAISVPAGTSHDIWKHDNSAPRLRQAANDTDFELEVRFDSALSARYQLQGLVAEQDDQNLVRFDFYSDGAVTRIFAASFVNGIPSTHIKQTVADSVPQYLRVTRQGNQWTESYSYDGANWQVAGTFTHSLTVTSVAVTGGNAGSPAPAHTALIDYFIVDGIAPGGGGDTTPDPVDSYALDIIDLGNGNVRVTGSAASVAPSLQVIIKNTDSGEQLVVFPEPDGSFSVELSAQSGDLLSVIVSDGSGNNSLPTEVYAGAFSIKNPYTADGHWYAGQTHMHTKDSDGVDYPHEMEIAYYDAGYDFVVSTDHRGTSPYFVESWRGLTPDPNSGNKNLLWIRGSELGFGEVHMGAWGQTVRTPIGTTGIQDQIDTVRSNGGITVMNHPENSTPAYSWDWNTEVRTTQGFSMVEAFNGKHPVEQEGSDHKLDAVDLADDFRQVWWIGTDDCHDRDIATEFDRYAIVVQTGSPVASEADILGSADAGNMYIRETAGGPELSGVAVVGNTVTVTLADIASVYNVVWKKRGDEVVQQDTGVNTVSTYTVQGNEGYVRAEIERVSDGLMAYTQPLFIGNTLDLSVSASASSGNGQALVDNDGSTVWDAGAYSGSFMVDVGTPRQVNALRVDWDDTDTRRFNYRIEASATGIFGGEEVEVVRETHANRSAATLDFFDVYARYIRVTITSQSVGSGDAVRIREVEVYNASPDGTDHYIDNVNGDDSNSGLAGSSWRTFNIARERTRPRDTLHFVNTGVPFTGLMELRNRHSGKHPGAVARYQGDPVNLTEIDATGYEFGVRFLVTAFIEWLNFAVHSANDANVIAIEADKSTGVFGSRIYDGLKRGVRADSDLTLGYNLIYGNTTEGVFVYRDGQDVDIYNNVFFGNAYGLFLDSYDIDATVRNNIFSANTSTALYETSSGTVIDSHNCVNGSYSGDWQKLSNVEADPLLVNPSAGNFALQSGSPCIDAGIDLGMTADFYGNDAFDVPAVPNTGSPGLFSRDFVDIGAIEYVQ